jgi:Lipoate synthase
MLLVSSNGDSICAGNNEHFSATGQIVSSQKLHTICQSGRCPNLGECWNQKSAIFMIGGDICTRACKFCNTKSGRPLPLDPNEPERVASSIRELNLKHIVLTSVDRGLRKRREKAGKSTW